MRAAQRRKQRRLRSWWRSSRSLRPGQIYPPLSPTGDRRRPGPGRRRARCTTRLRSGRLLLPSRSSSACAKKSPAGGGLPAWQSRKGHRTGSRGTQWSSLPNSLPWCRSSTLLCRRWWTSSRRSSSTSTSRCPSRLSKCPRSSSRTSRCEPWSVECSWRNSWWKCLCRPSATASSRRRCRRSFWHGT